MKKNTKHLVRALNYYVAAVCLVIYAVCIYRIVEALT